MAYAFENQVTRQLLTQYGFGLYLEKPDTVGTSEIADPRLVSAQYTEDQFRGAWVRFAMAEHDVNVFPPAWNNMVVPVAGYDRLRGVITLGQAIPSGDTAMAVEIWQRINPIDIRRQIYDGVLESVRVPEWVPLYDAWVPHPWLHGAHDQVVVRPSTTYLLEMGGFGHDSMTADGSFTIGPSANWWQYDDLLLMAAPGEDFYVGFFVETATAGEMGVGISNGAALLGSVSCVPTAGFHCVHVSTNGATQEMVTVAFRVPSGSVTFTRIGMRRVSSRTAVVPPAVLHADALTAVGMPVPAAGSDTQVEPLVLASDFSWALSHGTDRVAFGEPPMGIPVGRVLIHPEIIGNTEDLSSMETGVIVYRAPVYVIAAAAARNLLRRAELEYADVQGYSAWLQSAKAYAEQQLGQWRRGLMVNERSQNRIDHGNFAAPLGGYVESYVTW